MTYAHTTAVPPTPPLLSSLLPLRFAHSTPRALSIQLDLEIVKKVVLTQPELFVVDTKMRTPLHVAAYMGKHEVFAYLISLCESPMQLELEDDTGRTPFEILAAYNPVLDTHRNIVVDELREDVYVHLQLHSLV